VIKYKVTDINSKTRLTCSNGCHWAPGMVREATGTSDMLCTDAYIHWYDSPEIAVFMNPIHCWFYPARLWEVEAFGKIKYDGQLKGGSKHVRIIRELPLPLMFPYQRIQIAILCAGTCFDDEIWVKWARRWISGTDQSISGGEYMLDYLNSLVSNYKFPLSIPHNLSAAQRATSAVTELPGSGWAETTAAAAAVYANKVTDLQLQTIIDSVLK